MRAQVGVQLLLSSDDTWRINQCNARASAEELSVRNIAGLIGYLERARGGGGGGL